ncbi:MAG: TRAP transporter large permease [Deltaproteobacteria bacterium]|nr:TRAP transporter large permease [Deltaproteobacteria bacterium]
MTLLLITLLVGLVLGLPIFLALAAASLVVAWAVLALPPTFILHRMLESVHSYPLAAIPLFLLGGDLLTAGGYTRKLMDLAQSVGSRLGFGLPSVTVLVAFFLSGLTGAAVAEASALGGVLLPALDRSGVPKARSAALISVASTLGPIVPPSIPLILFGILAHVSIIELFWAGLVPGILTTLGLLVLARRLEAKTTESARPRDPAPWKQIWLQGIQTALPPTLVLGSMLGGLLTITEAAAGFVVLGGWFWARNPDRPPLSPILVKTALASAQVLIIIAGASALSYALTMLGFARNVQNLLTVWELGPLGFLILLNLVLLGIGTFLETTAALYLVVPVIVPLALALGVDPVHLGILTVFNLVLGMVTPPFGISLFVTSTIAGLEPRQVFERVWPFFFVGLAVLALILVFPDLCLFLPRLMIRGG